ncbi:MAG: hypothetical protein IJB89_04320 [Akkermansia sp.]|nr:hypothetical protein [Akkermansia sp.]
MVKKNMQKRMCPAAVGWLLVCLCLISCEEMIAGFQEGCRAGADSMNGVFANVYRNQQALQAAPPPVYAAPAPPVQQYGQLVRTHAYDLRCYAMHNYINQLSNGIAPKGEVARAAWQEFRQLHIVFEQLKQQKRRVNTAYEIQSNGRAFSRPGMQMFAHKKAIERRLDDQLWKIQSAARQFEGVNTTYFSILVNDKEAWAVYKENYVYYTWFFIPGSSVVCI